VDRPDREDSESWPGWATEPVIVVDHDPAWAGHGIAERIGLEAEGRADEMVGKLGWADERLKDAFRGWYRGRRRTR
jgi:hypothetical protein